jgi:hypothetical protein
MKLYSDGVLLNNNGFFESDGVPDSDESSFEEVQKRIRAHGNVTGTQVKSDDNYHYYLWRDAMRLVELLEAANEQIKELEKPASDFTINVDVGLDGEKIARAVQAFNEVINK